MEKEKIDRINHLARKHREQGLTEDAIAEQIGTGRKTYAYRIKKAAETLKKEFPDFF